MNKGFNIEIGRQFKESPSHIPHEMERIIEESKEDEESVVTKSMTSMYSTVKAGDMSSAAR